jgi:hypothetical protein
MEAKGSPSSQDLGAMLGLPKLPEPERPPSTERGSLEKSTAKAKSSRNSRRGGRSKSNLKHHGQGKFKYVYDMK